jgi:hypothetical protein
MVEWRVKKLSDNLAPTRRIFMKFDIWGFFENLSRIFKFHLYRTRIKGTLHEDQYPFFVISLSFLLGMRNMSYKSCIENQNTLFVFCNFFSKIVPFMRKCGKVL